MQVCPPSHFTQNYKRLSQRSPIAYKIIRKIACISTYFSEFTLATTRVINKQIPRNISEKQRKIIYERFQTCKLWSRYKQYKSGRDVSYRLDRLYIVCHFVFNDWHPFLHLYMYPKSTPKASPSSDLRGESVNWQQKWLFWTILWQGRHILCYTIVLT